MPDFMRIGGVTGGFARADRRGGRHLDIHARYPEVARSHAGDRGRPLASGRTGRIPIRRRRSR